jgi:hypothetical protein
VSAGDGRKHRGRGRNRRTRAGRVLAVDTGSSGRTRHHTDCGFVPRCPEPPPQLRGTPGVRQLGAVAREALSRPWAAPEGDFVPLAAPAGQRIAPATQNRTSRRPNRARWCPADHGQRRTCSPACSTQQQRRWVASATQTPTRRRRLPSRFFIA